MKHGEHDVEWQISLQGIHLSASELILEQRRKLLKYIEFLKI